MTTSRFFAFFLFSTACFLKAENAPAPLDPLVLRPDLWKATTTELAENLKSLQFEWTSVAQDSARSVHPGLTLNNQRVYEALLRFANQSPVEAKLLIFNRGDAGDLSREQFEKLIADVAANISTFTGKQPIDRGRDATSAVKADGYIWDTDTTRFLLEWSMTKESKVKQIPFRAEFIRLTIQPKDTSVRAIGAAHAAVGSRNAVKKFVGASHVEKLPGGAKIKDVPMVDQGQKGYCVVASVERVMRYYGASVDQHELAQMADSDAEGGTNANAMLESLKKLTARLGVKVRPIQEWDFREFLKMIDDYNRAAKRAKKPEVQLGGQIVDVSACYAQMDPAIYKELRLKKTADFGKFTREIQRNIDEGLPLLWSVRLGLVPEKGIPQVSGGHMRLIIGYDTTAKEIIYTDSWGMGHEEKRMSMDDAWTMTSGLSSIQPLS